MPVFIECFPCGNKWFNQDDFLEDLSIEIIGYQVNFNELEAGVLLFKHSCGATLDLSVRDFKKLFPGPIFIKRATGTEECPEYCLYQDKLDLCPSVCECAYVRAIIDIIKNWPKKKTEESL